MDDNQPVGIEALDATIHRLAERDVPGISVEIVDADGSFRESAAGYRDLSSNAPAGPDTVYLWFSMTKIVTATAVMQLNETGALDLDDYAEKFLPGFPARGHGAEKVRVRHLLSHSAGLANPLPVRWVHPDGQPGRDSHAFAEELLRRQRRLRYQAGSRAVYSNPGYIALGEVIAAAAGRPFEEYVQAEILDRLSMTRTGFTYSGLGDDVAVGYQRRLHPMTPLFRLLLPKGIIGAPAGRFLAFNRFLVDGPAYGGLVGSPRDAARFMAAHLRGGEIDGVRLLSPESVREMQTIQARGKKLDVGFGWFRRGKDRSSQEVFVEHLGGGGGFWNMMRLYPDRGLGVLSMGNATSYDHGAVAQAALAAS